MRMAAIGKGKQAVSFELRKITCSVQTVRAKALIPLQSEKCCVVRVRSKSDRRSWSRTDYSTVSTLHTDLTQLSVPAVYAVWLGHWFSNLSCQPRHFLCSHNSVLQSSSVGCPPGSKGPQQGSPRMQQQLKDSLCF